METDYANFGLWALMAAAFLLATTHSINPDHWFPFVMVGRAKKWKTSWVLGLACVAGIGHVGTSVVIGLMGVYAKKGTASDIAIFLENATPLLLILFGFGYAVYATYKLRVGQHGHSHGIAFINRWLGIDPHNYIYKGHKRRYDHDHGHTHGTGGTAENHDHGAEEHLRSTSRLRSKNAGWGLVAILGLTPCIALLPLTFASVKYGTMAIIFVNIVFALSTIATILLMTWLGFLGLAFVRFDFFDEYGEIIAGVIIGLMGMMIKLLGL
jgi:ABC-type nickel/cobalt efflux system permease component RcnA